MTTGDPLDFIEQALPRTMQRLFPANGMDSQLFALPLAQLRLINVLADKDWIETGAPMSGLSERLGVRLNAVSQLADRLVSNGLAHRCADSEDRRVVRLQLSAKGRQWVEARRARRRERLKKLWSIMNDAERAALLQAVQLLSSAADRMEEV